MHAKQDAIDLAEKFGLAEEFKELYNKYYYDLDYSKQDAIDTALIELDLIRD